MDIEAPPFGQGQDFFGKDEAIGRNDNGVRLKGCQIVKLFLIAAEFQGCPDGKVMGVSGEMHGLFLERLSASRWAGAVYKRPGFRGQHQVIPQEQERRNRVNP